MNSSLTGWLRGWIFLSTIWVVVVLLVTYESFPSESKVKSDYRSQSYDLFNIQGSIEEAKAWCRKEDEGLHLYVECLRINNVEGKEKNLSLNRENHFKNERKFVDDEMSRLYKDYFIYVFVLLIFPILSFLLLGFGVRWVIRGFKIS